MHDVNIPALGMAMTEAVLTQWHKQPGDPVAVGEVIAEIETDKSNVDLESPADGVLGAHLVAAGDAVPDRRSRRADPRARRDRGRCHRASDRASRRRPRPTAAARGHRRSPQPAAPSPSGGHRRQRFLPPWPKTPHALSPRKRRLARLEAEADAFFAVTAEGGPTQPVKLLPPPRAPPRRR